MLLSESNLLGAFSRILLASSHWTNSEEYSYVWNRLDTRFALSAFQLTVWEPNTEGNGCSLWQTPVADDAMNRENGKINSRASQLQREVVADAAQGGLQRPGQGTRGSSTK